MTATILSLAMLLDAALGEPEWLWRRLPHPAVLMGRAVTWCDVRLNRGTARRARGIVAVLILVVSTAAIGGLLSLLGSLAEVVAAAMLLAQKSLADHVRAVARDLRQSLPAGRQAVSQIVGRDTAQMDAPAVARAAIESAAENLSDGVIAPAFWFLVAGLPGMLIYKAVNTADSMIGYRTPRHAEFGWAAARLDDLLNLIPARLTALLLALPGGALGQLRAIRQDAALHRSPNAGWPEAAIARTLDVALSGPRAYDGQMQEFPFVHPEGRRTLDARDIDATVVCLWQAWALALACCIIVAVITM